MRPVRRWRSGLGVAAVSFVVGSVRLVATGATDRLTWAWFLVAGLYAFAALVVRRLGLPERAEDWLGRLERTPRFATLLQQHSSPSRLHPESNVAQRIRYLQHGTDETVTRNRIANALAVAAAVVGLVLVSGAGHTDGHLPDPSPSSSGVAPGQDR